MGVQLEKGDARISCKVVAEMCFMDTAAWKTQKRLEDDIKINLVEPIQD